MNNLLLQTNNLLVKTHNLLVKTNNSSQNKMSNFINLGKKCGK